MPDRTERKIKLLFLASNPGNTPALDISGEQRAISESIRKSIHGEDITLVTELAVRPGDLADLLMRHKPDIVHFSGHGMTGGTLVLEDDTRQRQSVTLAAFAGLISTVRGNIRLVVLNACWSSTLAEQLAAENCIAVGMDRSIDDESAGIFAAGFYNAIGNGQTVSNAYAVGKNAISIRNLPDSTVPQIKTPLDADEICFFSAAVEGPNTENLHLSLLKKAIEETNSELLIYENRIANIHLERPEVDLILEWLQNSPRDQQIAILIDQPGGGKTVIMRSVLERLKQLGIQVLAIKCDSLGEIHGSGGLSTRCHLPVSITVEECVRTLTAIGPVVILVDQLDALSMTLSRDQATLDTIFSTIAHLKAIDGVKILASCRAFDLRNDPILSTIKVDHNFQLSRLTDEAVNQILGQLNIDALTLLPVQRKLLTVPLHLQIYAQIITDNSSGEPLEKFQNLHELYAVLWRKRIENPIVDAPSPTERQSLVYYLVDHMGDKQQTVVPVAAVEQYTEAARFLERQAFIRRERHNYLFLHQTLFDYAFARRFHAQGKLLHSSILTSSQGFFERSIMVQVLAYLRSVSTEAYETDLQALLFSDKLRVHLRLLLLRWFGGLTSPSEYELTIARRLMGNPKDISLFFAAISGNLDWYACLRKHDIPQLMGSPEGFKVDLVVQLLSSYINSIPADVTGLLRPYIGRNADWNRRISVCVNMIFRN